MMSDFEEKRQARIDRLHKAAERATTEALAQDKEAHCMMDVIPFGQPVHGVRDRNFRDKIDRKLHKAYNAGKEADTLERRARAAESNLAIFTDDPQAGDKLADKIARLERRQEMMKATNKLVRKGDRAGLLDMGFSEVVVAKMCDEGDCFGNKGFPPYETTNNAANIRRLKGRLAQVEAHAGDVTSEKAVGAVRIVDDVEENRVRVYFPGRPDQMVVTALKGSGFHWTPSLGCWQRMRSNGAMYHAEQIAKMAESIA